MDRKSSRNVPGKRTQRADRPRKRRVFNQYEAEKGLEKPGVSAKKQKRVDREEISVNSDISYRILNFITVFGSLSQYVKCNECGSAVKFTDGSRRGLGFKIFINCENCEQRQINSCPYIGNAYEINTKFVFAMRLLGVSLAGAEKFCAFMDLPQPIFRSFYSALLQKIREASKLVRLSCTNRAATDEKTSTFRQNPDAEGITVSGAGSWRERGVASLYGMAALIGQCTKKVIDVQAKSSFCQACASWKRKRGTNEYADWHEQHVANGDCDANLEDSVGKMEADAVREMFQRSESSHGTRYKHFVVDADSRTYKQVLESEPYEGVSVDNRECVLRVQNRMASRLRACRALGEKGKLTGNLIDELTVDYGNAIRRNADNLANMTKAVWATFYHRISSNEYPRHENCPEGEGSWCSWQRAKAEDTLDAHEHDKALHPDVIKAIEPIYAEFSKKDLLERCLGAADDGNCGGLKSVIWKFVPETTFGGAAVVETAVDLGIVLFNEGHVGLVRVLQELGVQIGDKVYEYCLNIDDRRLAVAEERAQETQEIRDELEAVEDLLYGPGIGD